jgi:hypothetical protein
MTRHTFLAAFTSIHSFCMSPMACSSQPLCVCPHSLYVSVLLASMHLSLHSVSQLVSLSTSSHLVDLLMPRKKHPLNDEFNSAIAKFDNPFHKKLKYTIMATLAITSKVNIVHESRTLSYHPPSIPLIIGEKNASTPSEPKHKTQVSTF